MLMRDGRSGGLGPDITASEVVTGQLVKELKGQAHAGLNSLVWDGRNSGGAGTSSGVYIYRLEVTPQDNGKPITSNGKLVRVK